jgi:hypothetical protein
MVGVFTALYTIGEIQIIKKLSGAVKTPTKGSIWLIGRKKLILIGQSDKKHSHPWLNRQHWYTNA